MKTKIINSDFFGSSNYGGVKATIDGRKVGFGSIKGSVIYRLGLWESDAYQAFQKSAENVDLSLDDYLDCLISAKKVSATANNWPLVWINVSCSVLSDVIARDADAKVIALKTGDEVCFDGVLYRIDSAANSNFRLVLI